MPQFQSLPSGVQFQSLLAEVQEILYMAVSIAYQNQDYSPIEHLNETGLELLGLIYEDLAANRPSPKDTDHLYL